MKLDLNHQFQGFLKTPLLWQSNAIYGLNMFNYKAENNQALNLVISNNLRLGKLVERFVSFELTQMSAVDIIAENIQIQNEGITVGEIDCLLFQNGIPIHLEIVYKFYLYDASEGDTELDHWIGPNRRDSLVKKLNKLTEKQLPLLYNKHTQPHLNHYNLSVETIQQQLYFKAQLFVPLTDFKTKVFPEVNNDCIVGFYIYKDQLQQFKNCKFYIPTKHNWLVQPTTHTDWLTFEKFQEQLQLFLSQKSSPLC